MTLEQVLISWRNHERASLQQQLDLLESGILTTGETNLGSPRIDTTAETIQDARRKIVELDSLLYETTAP